MRKKDLIQNDYGKVYLFSKFFIDLRNRIRNCNKSIYDRIHKYLGEPTNDLHLMNKSFCYLTGGNNNFPKNTNNIKRNIINKNLLVWGKNERSNSYCDDTEPLSFALAPIPEFQHTPLPLKCCKLGSIPQLLPLFSPLDSHLNLSKSVGVCHMVLETEGEINIS
jgi:hypothetical protein